MSRDFLWTGVELRRSGSKVGWGQVCTPKCEVGFGLKLEQGLYILRRLWAICKRVDTMWLKWIHSDI